MKSLIRYVIILLLVSCSTIRTSVWPKKTLKQASSKPIGVAVDSKQIEVNKAYREIVIRNYDSITTENALKMNRVQPQKGIFDFSQADSLLNFALTNKLKFKAHPIIWHRQLPNWLGEVKQGEFEKIFENHIRTLVRRYKGKVVSWDVVNEAFLRNGDYRPNIWYVALGPSYIEKAFLIAHQEDPNARLFYNDFQIEKVNPKFETVYRILRELKARGIPIDGVGLQSHFSHKYNVQKKEISDVIRRFSELGLAVEITELDVAIPKDDKTQKKQVLKIQADTYSMVGNVCSQFKSCVGITLWGLDDAHSWVPKEFPGLGEATLFDQNFMPKPIYEIFKDSLE